MLPSTFLGLLLFLWLITPGFLYNLLAARRRIVQPASTFQEITRVVLASALFFGVAGALVLGVEGLIFRGGFQLARAVNGGALYLRQHYLWVAGLLTTQVVLACLMAWGADGIFKWHTRHSTGRAAPRLKAESAWTPLLSTAPNAAHAYVWLRLKSGIELIGRVEGFGHEIAVADRELVLAAPIKMKEAGGKVADVPWQYLAVDGGDIESLAVKYVGDTPAPTSAAGG
jgi:hypothetical protein